MTEMTIALEERDLEALSEIALSIGTSGEALARGAIRKLIDDLSEARCEPFATEEEASEFIEDHARKAMRNAW